MTEIGRGQITVPGGGSTSFSVDATLPAALSAVGFEFTVSGTDTGVTQKDFSVSTDVSGDCLGGLSDDGCLQAAINPLGLVSALAPVTILYEPPGSCSFASFTANSVQGTTVAIDTTSGMNTGTLTTIPDTESGTTSTENVTLSKTDTNTKSNQMQMTTGTTVFTVQGGSSAPPNCAARTTGGPGRGDVFEILDNAPFVYWNTGNLSNSRFRATTTDPTTTEPFIPGQIPGLLVITADQLKTLPPAQLPGSLPGRSQADRDAILGLDPLVALAASNSSGAATTAPFMALPLPRYAPLPIRPELAPNLPFQVQQTATDTQVNSTVVKSSTSQVNGLMSGQPLEEKLIQDGVTAGLTSALTAIINVPSGGAGNAPTFSWVNTVFTDYLKSLSQEPTVKTQVETTLSGSNTISNLNGGGSVQSLFMRDPNRSLNVQLYWDQLFGTIAYQEVPAVMGTMSLSELAAAASLGKPLANVAWVKTIVAGRNASTVYPPSIIQQLTSVVGGGTFTLSAVSAASFQTFTGFTAGLPTGVTVGLSGIDGTTNVAAGVYQQAFFILDSAGNKDGVFWQTVAVAAPNASENAMCSSTPNSGVPGTEIVTCCSLAGLCDSFVAPTGGARVHLEAEANSGSSGVTPAGTEVSAGADGAFVKFAGINLGIVDGSISSFVARALPSAAGQSLELWADASTSAAGGTQLATLALDGTAQNCAGSWADRHQTRSALVNGAPSGSHDVYVVFRGPAGDKLDWIELSFEAIPPSGPRIQYRVGDVGQPNDNQLQPWISVVNGGGTDMTLKDLTVRYWYTIETGAPQVLNVDFAPFGSQLVSGTFEPQVVPKQGADQALAVSFPNAGCFVPPGGSSGEVHLRVNKTNWSVFNETNDYSYDATKTTFADSMRLTAYRGGKLVWGDEPAAIAGGETASSGTHLRVQYRVGDPGQSGDNAIKPQFNIINDNTVSVPLQQLTLRYWFTAETDMNANFWCDYALMGNANVTGRVVKLATPRAGADRYLEVSFTAGAGSLFPLGTSGEIQTRVSPVDWSAYNELNDYSYNASHTMFADWSRATLYRNGTLVWGTEP